MTINLPKDVESSINAEVLSGHFASVDDAITAAWRVFLRQQRQEQASFNQSALTPEELAEQELQRRLFEAGVVSEIKPPRRFTPERERFTPVPIQGEPLSETIIRERR
jgi:Arc/MetJ-type ribon-helix-helix transcriptional regulator